LHISIFRFSCTLFVYSVVCFCINSVHFYIFLHTVLNRIC
jgi:hypothetical protein